MSYLTNSSFWGKTAERVVGTFAASLGGLLTAGAAGLLDAPWEASMSAAGLAGLLTLLKCVAAGASDSGEGPGDPGLV